MHPSRTRNTGAIVSAALLGTTVMTLFSYLVAEIQKEKFREPELLATLLRRLVPELSSKYGRIAGWKIHYAVGLVFAIIYARLWEEKRVKPSAKSGLALGALSALPAIAVWRLTFLLHPSPPKIHFKRFYGHLFLAHLVFGAFAAIGYKIVMRQNKDGERDDVMHSPSE